MRSSGEGVGGENHRQFRGSTVGIDLELEDPVHGDAGDAVVGAEESEPAHARSRETEASHGAGYLGFRESPAAGPGIGSVNPGAGVAHGRIRIVKACGDPTSTGHVERIDDDVGAACGGGAGDRDHQGMSRAGYTLTATGAGSATSAAFNITAGTAATITINAGDGQTATVGTPVPIPPSVIVRDQFGNPVLSVDVTFAPAPGSGTVEPTGSIATGADGLADVTSWPLGPLAGPNFLTATAPAIGVSGNQVTFTATGTPATASQLVFTTQPSDVVVGNKRQPPVVVTARDQFGNTATAFTGDEIGRAS